MPAKKFDYDVAFSFAGENRDFVEPIADRLKQLSVSVFYDREKRAEMWGKNLDEYLSEIYLKQARFCVMFVSREYAEKMWTRLERRSAMARAMQQKREYILPIKLDQTELEGLRPTIHYISAADHDAESIVQLIIEKLDRDSTAGGGAPAPARTSAFNIPLPKVKKTFSQREKDVFGRASFETIQHYFDEGLKRLKESDADIEIDFDPVHRSKFLCRVYVKGEPVNTCKIWLGGWSHSGSDDHISYYEGSSVSPDRDDATNDMVSVITDGHKLGLENTGFNHFRTGAERKELLSPVEAAEVLWERFTQRLSGH